jgi:hypothetical protein
VIGGVARVGKWLSAFWCHDGHYQRLADDNRQATEAYNEEMLSLIGAVGALLSLLPLLAVPFSHTRRCWRPAYLLGTSISNGSLFLLFRLTGDEKNTRWQGCTFSFPPSFCSHDLCEPHPLARNAGDHPAGRVQRCADGHSSTAPAA